MRNSNSFRNNEEKNVFATLKILILFFSVIPVAQALLLLNSDTEVIEFNIGKMLSFLLIISIITVFWFIINYNFKNDTVRVTIEISIMFSMCMLCYFTTGQHLSNYKFVFALMVLIYTVEYAMKAGIFIALCSGVALMISDYVNCTSEIRSKYFQSDIILLATFVLIAYIVGYYVEKDRNLIEKLEESANRDSLTELYNHRYFHQYIHDLMKTENREENFLFFMDIDYFKVYNDTFGHQKGDIVLKKIGALCKAGVPTGTAFRYGGEEFAILVAVDDAKQAEQMANNLRELISNFPFEGEELMPGHDLTVSIGVAEKKNEGDTAADWIGRADNALYRAKFFRKNRVQVYTPVFERFESLDNMDDDRRILSIKSLLSIINSRDRYTYNHTDRVVHYCEIYAKYANMTEEDTRTLLYAAYLHDIGKINIPQEILISEKRLTDIQWKAIRKHPQDGAEIARRIKNFDTVADIVLQHHEKFDGSGYPNGVKGEELNPLSRILTLADSFDAMTANRHYQKAKNFEEAFEEIRKCRGTQFDPDIAEKFVDAIESAYN